MQNKLNNHLINDILNRGVQDILPSAQALAKVMSSKKIRVYLGIDPTGDTLHLGHAVVLRKLQQFADYGCQTILLIGDGTVKIGDPTGRDTSRPMLTDEQIQQNFKNWKKQASKILDFDKIEIRYNGEWLNKLSFTDLVNLMAKVTIQQIIERDMFQKRLAMNLPIFTHELIYPLLQGYDSVAMDVDLEIGGNDQVFNMMMGRNLQKIYRNREKFVLATPLIAGTDGKKMSKSHHNYVALTESPETIYGKIMSLQDELIFEYFTIFTDLKRQEITDMQQAVKEGTNPIVYKKRLAFEITSWLNDHKLAQKAEKDFEAKFQGKTELKNLPKVNVQKGITILELIKICKPELSNSQIRRLIQQKAITNLSDEQTIETEKQIIDKDFKLRIGKTSFYQIQIKT